MAPHLFAVRGPLDGRSFPIEQQPISLGRGSDNSIVVDNKLASRRHAEIRPEARGYVLYDLNSSNGTQVNGQQVQSHVLENGDVIIIGEQTFVFREHQPAQQHEQPPTRTLPPQLSPFQQPYAPLQPEPEIPPAATFAGDPAPAPAPAAPYSPIAPPMPIEAPQSAATTQSTVSRIGSLVMFLGGLLLVAAFFLPYIVFTVPLGGLPLLQLNDVVLTLSGLQIIQAALGVNDLSAELTAGLPTPVQNAVEPLIEQPLADIRAHLVWFVLPAIGSFLAGIWYILIGGTAAIGMFTGKRILLNVVRFISLTSSLLILLALGNAYVQRSNILDVSNVFISLSSGFWLVLAGLLVAIGGMLFIRASASGATR